MLRIKGRKASRIAVAAALVASFAAPPAFAACATKEEQQASKLRVLQTELMVAALKCRTAELGIAERYNGFVQKFSAELINNARVLQSHFKKTYGGDGQRRFDAWITTLANDASIRHPGHYEACKETPPLLETVMAMTGEELKQFAANMNPFAHSSVQKDCGEAAPAKAAAPAPKKDKVAKKEKTPAATPANGG